MIISRIWGGLGNQMFQYAVAYAIAKQKKEPLKLDISFFERKLNGNRITPRELELLELPIEKCEYINNISKYDFKINFFQIPSVNYFLRKLKSDYITIGKYYLETQYRFHKDLLKNIIAKNKDVYLDGYWHCDKYFSMYRKEIIKMFCFENDNIKMFFDNVVLQEFIAVGVHVRRGDYITQNNPNVRGEEYYRKGIEYIYSRVENPIFCFFSDDPQWVKNTFSDIKNFIIVNEDRKMTDVEELQIMCKCKHNIISNSSFSWWGAWLNEYEDKIVIAPKVWKNKQDMMLENWILL